MSFLKPPHRRWSRKDTAELERLWRANVMASDIAPRLGRTRSAVLGKLHRMGLLGMEPARRRARDERIARRYSEGETAARLSTVHGLCPARITEIARLYGIYRGAGRPRVNPVRQGSARA